MPHSVPWFRFYHEVLDDPKVQRLPAELFRVWVNCLCLAARNDGQIPPLSDVSFAFRETPEHCEILLQELVKAGLLDCFKGGILRPHNWDSRQFKSDSSTERVKRFRERSKKVSETLDETDQTRTEQSRTDTTPAYSIEFLEFWKLYPRKEAKGEAWKVWQRLRPTDTIRSSIARAVESQKLSSEWKRDFGKFIPHPATWLNKRRWEDESTGGPTLGRMPDKPVPVC